MIMNSNTLKMAMTAMILGLLAGSAVGADPPIYGSQLMTNQERIEHRNKLRAAKTAEERERYRLEHHEQMQLRAKERGVTLPAEPPVRGGGMGPDGGMGGMGPGGGMGGMGGGRR
jgi:hypothetical protein